MQIGNQIVRIGSINLDYVKQSGAKLVIKKGLFWNLLHYLVMIVTFGGNRRFKYDYLTTLGNRIAVPMEDWERILNSPYAPHIKGVIEHELVHVRQFRKYGFGNVWLGMVTMGFCYLLLPLPVGFAWCRWKLEREAYLVSLQYTTNPESRAAYTKFISKQLTSGAYGWTLLPFFRGYIERWFAKQLGR
jgi:hypothetical protein